MPRRRGSGAQGRRGKEKWSMDYTLVKQVRDNAPLRESFFALARRVFGLSFEEWHRAGWWTDRYVPYTMVYRDGSAAANVSVNRIDTVWRGEALRLVQLGTVMTAPEHRGKGLARSLMEAVLDDWGPHLRRRLSLCQRHGAGVLPQIRLRPRAGACLHTAAARPGRRSGGGRFCAAGHGHAGRARAAAALL